MVKVKKECIPVVFRIGGEFREPIALFPTIAEGRGLCSSYEHVGQHGGADCSGIVARTRLARPSEYRNLKRELERIGYCLKVLKRAPPRRLQV